MEDLRTEPRFSINKLAEYITATPARRRRLILDQIAPPAFQVQRYQFALPIAQRFLCDPAKDVALLADGAASLRDRASRGDDSAHTNTCLIDSARALEAFIEIAPEFGKTRLIAVRGHRRDNAMRIGGVRVSVWPEVYLVDPGTELHVGAIKFHTARTRQLTTESLRYVAVILFKFCHVRSDAVQPGKCIAADVFGGRIETAPRAIQTKVGEVRAACEEIAERWPSLVVVARQEGASRA